jgi:hypothetical protein
MITVQGGRVKNLQGRTKKDVSPEIHNQIMGVIIGDSHQKSMFSFPVAVGHARDAFLKFGLNGTGWNRGASGRS